MPHIEDVYRDLYVSPFVDHVIKEELFNRGVLIDGVPGVQGAIHRMLAKNDNEGNYIISGIEPTLNGSNCDITAGVINYEGVLYNITSANSVPLTYDQTIVVGYFDGSNFVFEALDAETVDVYDTNYVYIALWLSYTNTLYDMRKGRRLNGTTYYYNISMPIRRIFKGDDLYPVGHFEEFDLVYKIHNPSDTKILAFTNDAAAIITDTIFSLQADGDIELKSYNAVGGPSAVFYSDNIKIKAGNALLHLEQNNQLYLKSQEGKNIRIKAGDTDIYDTSFTNLGDIDIDANTITIDGRVGTDIGNITINDSVVIDAKYHNVFATAGITIASDINAVFKGKENTYLYSDNEANKIQLDSAGNTILTSPGYISNDCAGNFVVTSDSEVNITSVANMTLNSGGSYFTAKNGIGEIQITTGSVLLKLNGTSRLSIGANDTNVISNSGNVILGETGAGKVYVYVRNDGNDKIDLVTDGTTRFRVRDYQCEFAVKVDMGAQNIVSIGDLIYSSYKTAWVTVSPAAVTAGSYYVVSDGNVKADVSDTDITCVPFSLPPNALNIKRIIVKTGNVGVAVYLHEVKYDGTGAIKTNLGTTATYGILDVSITLTAHNDKVYTIVVPSMKDFYGAWIQYEYVSPS